MTRERWNRIQELFYSAADLPADRRAGYLREACAGDTALEQHIEDLLSAEAEAAGFLDGALSAAAEEITGVQPGERLGSYRIIEGLGHGGMGDVYLAERDDQQFQMRVAIKLIRCEAAPPRMLARFRAERQILASLEHPNIARLLDGGASGGSPYLVMEYVPGEPIDRYCIRHSLSIRERLRLFRDLCQAVAYAHRHLVIHRDIKPSNILVTADGVPKLLDFGIATLMKPEQEADGVTRPLERVMTPVYASPEVVRGERVTTAADVYSLGALLYELLTGRAPFHLRSSQAAEVQRVICQEEPPKPGTLDRRLRGDLENIILMAMHKEAARRYASAEQLIADVDRYLTGYPVAARSDRLYRCGKFVRRNRGALAAAIIALAGVAGWLLSLRAEQARTRRGFAEVRELAESLLFETDDALRPVAGTTSAREAIVKRGLRYLDSLARETKPDLKLQEELADAYERVADIQFSPGPSLGQPAGALESCRRALAIRQALAARAPGDPMLKSKLAVSYLRLSSLQQNQDDPAGAQQSFRMAAAILDALKRAMPDDVTVRLNIAALYQEEGRRQYLLSNFAAARSLMENERELLDRILAADPRNRAAQRQFAEAELGLLENMGATSYAISAVGHQTGLEIYHAAEQDLTALAEERPGDSTTAMLRISLYTRGCGLTGLLDPDSELAACRKATQLADYLSSTDPVNTPARLAAINAHHDLAGRMQEKGEPGFMDELRRATEMADRLFAEKPDVIVIRSTASIEHQGLAELLLRSGQPVAALAEVRKAAQLREPLLLDPADTRPRLKQAEAYTMAGDIEFQLPGSRDEATVSYRTAVEMFAPLRNEHKLDEREEQMMMHDMGRLAGPRRR